MKLFGSKKDSNNTNVSAESTEEIYRPDTTQGINVQKDPMDDFSLDGLDLDALDDDFGNLSTTPQPISQPMATTTPVTPAVATPATTTHSLDDDVFSFDDLDLGDIPPQTNTTPQTTTPTAHQSDFSAEAMDLNIFDNLDDLDLNTPTATSATTPVTTPVVTTKTDITDTASETVPAPSAPQPVLTKTDEHTPPADFDDTIDKIMAQPVSTPVPEKKKTGLFGRTATKKTVVTKQPLPAKKKDNNKLLMLLLPLLLLGAGAWYFMTQMNDEPAPAPVAAPVVKPKPAAPVASTPTVASTVTASVTASTASATATASSVSTTSSTATTATASSPTDTPVNTVSAEEILKPALPEDPAIAKEEMDRLAEQSNQLKEQEKMIEEQLAMMNELSSKKEERIKLLEQQVAQLEQQKAGKATTAKP